MIVSQLKSSDCIGSILVSRIESSKVKSAKRFVGNPSFEFKLQPNFLKVIRSVEGSDPIKTIFSYEEIIEHFSSYIVSKRNEIFDPRNLKLALVRNDPLGVAFNVSAFHRCQAR